MAAEEEERVIEKFIRPVRNLYTDYAITLDQFKQDNVLLLANYELEDLGANKDYKLYAEFSEENDGELAKEGVQTWICDNRLEVSNCIRIALENRKQPFCNWYRDSEKYLSPDELLLYCLGKQTHKHVSIFNNKYVWSTLANHIRYDYFEIVQHSNVILVMLGERHYAIFRKKTAHEDNTPKDDFTNSGRGKGKGRGRSKVTKSSKRKIVCRSSTTGRTSKAGEKRSQTLESARQNRYGIGIGKSKLDTEKYGRGKRTKGQSIDYLKLNEGYDEDFVDTSTPSPKKAKHLPV